MPMFNRTVATTNTLLVKANPRRKVLTIQNIDAASYVDIADKSNSDGLRLHPGEEVIFHETDGDDPQRAFYGIASASMSVRIYEALRPAPFVEHFERPQRRFFSYRRPGGASSGSAPAGRGGGGGESRTK